MGCVSSKRIEAAVDPYRPPPSSFAVFDVHAIEEPWLKGGGDGDAAADDSLDEKQPSHVPPPLLEKLNAIDDAPRTWDEVSKALEDLKPELNASPPPPPPNDAPPPPPPLTKNQSFHTLEELEAKISPPKPANRNESRRVDTAAAAAAVVPVAKSLKDNIFIQKDREEREKEGKSATGFVRRDPLADFEEICPPGGEEAVVVYTTSLGGVRRTYEDCNRVRQLMETYQVVYDERDVALDGGFRGELRGLVGAGAGVPRVFVKGRYIGGAEEVVGLNETGRLSRILNWARVERGAGRAGCRGCGGARFVPCLGCGGSCKVVVEGKRERCGECNENGLAHCPLCA